MNIYSILPSSALAAISANPSQWLSKFESKLQAGITPGWVDELPSGYLGASLTSFSTTLSSYYGSSYTDEGYPTSISSDSSIPYQSSSTTITSSSSPPTTSIHFSDFHVASASSTSRQGGPTQGSSSDKNSTAAIAGGVVGGVVGLAAIAGAIIFVLFRRKRKEYKPPMREVSTY